MSMTTMHTISPPLRIPAFVGLCLFAGVMFMPFTGMAGPSFLGELARCLSVWFFIPAILSGLVTGFPLADRSTKGVFTFAILFCATIILSFFSNFDTVLNSEFRDRSGLNKYFTSFLVVLYGFSISWIFTHIFSKNSGKDSLYHYVIKPSQYAILITGCVALIEIAWWIIPSFEPIMSFVSKLLRPYSETLGFWGRLTTVSFEPHSFGLWLGFTNILFLWCFLFPQPLFSRKWALSFLSASVIMLLLSQSRGGLIISLAGGGMLFAAFFLKRQSKSYMMLNYMPPIAFLSILLIQMTFVDVIADKVLLGNSISNLSRYAMNVTAFNMFSNNVFTGYGFGQFGFHAINNVPSWGWVSYELVNWLLEEVNGWPSTFSMPGRLLSETGLIGFTAWYGGNFVLFSLAIQRQLRAGNTDMAALLMALLTFVFFFGISVETFNHIGLWISIGLASASLLEQPKNQDS